MRRKVLIPYREDITYREMGEALEREVEKLGWALSKSGGQLIDVQAAEQLVAAVHGGHVGGGQGQAQAGGGDPLVERFGELLDREEPAGHLDG